MPEAKLYVYQAVVEIYDDDECDYRICASSSLFQTQKQAQTALDKMERPNGPHDDFCAEVKKIAVY